jgi:hypothetical protein
MSADSVVPEAVSEGKNDGWRSRNQNRDEDRELRIEDSESSRGEFRHCAKNTKFESKILSKSF